MIFMKNAFVSVCLLSLLFMPLVFAQSGDDTIQLEPPTPPEADFTGFISETYNSPDTDGVWGFTIVYGFSGGELVDIQKMGEAVFMPYPAPKSDETGNDSVE